MKFIKQCFFTWLLFVLLLLNIVLFFIICVFNRTKTYYYPEVGLFVSTRIEFLDDYGYICVAKDKGSLSNNHNCLYLYKATEDLDVILLVDIHNPEHIFYTDPGHLVLSINNDSYEFEKISLYDDRYFKTAKFPMIECKEGFFRINVN